MFVFGEPEICVVAFGSKQFDIFALGDELTARDWKLNALQFPSRFVSTYIDHLLVSLTGLYYFLEKANFFKVLQV